MVWQVVYILFGCELDGGLQFVLCFVLLVDYDVVVDQCCVFVWIWCQVDVVFVDLVDGDVVVYVQYCVGVWFELGCIVQCFGFLMCLCGIGGYQ